MNINFEQLKKLREESGYTQKYVSDYLNIKQPQYSRYERGLRDVPTDILISLAKLYNTSTDYILGLTSKKEPYPKD
ncbi:MAG: helix-turn-helix transcriptional regulator [Clostridia bacterium]|nr:helix-turn-helix transcriptional regulator [Clostridia bacterium]